MEKAEIAATLSARPSKTLSLNVLSYVLRIIDFLIIAAIGGIIYAIYVDPGLNQLSTRYIGTVIICSLVASSIFERLRIYEDEYLISEHPRINRLLWGWTLTFGLLLAIAFSLKISDYYSRVWVVSWFVGVSIALVTSRVAWGVWIEKQKIDCQFGDRIIIVGAGDKGRKVARCFLSHPSPVVNVVGFVDDRNDRIPQTCEGVAILGDTEHLVELVRRNLVDQVLIALPSSAEDRLHDIVHRLSVTPVKISVVPDIFNFDLANMSVKKIGAIPVLQIFDRPISGWSYVLKRCEDCILALASLFLLFPLMLLIAIAVKLDSAGPILFRQPRLGFNNALINVLKFRTMYVDQSDLDGECQTKRNDPRVTKVGRILRRTSLDELPQLFNVLRGEMSFVGPRPHAVATRAGGELFADAVERYAARHRVKPGITGWAQVNGWRGETDTVEKIRNRVEHDLYYIENWSLWLDLYILMKTLVVIVRDEKAY